MMGTWQILESLLEADDDKRYHGGPPRQEKPKSAAEYRSALLKHITRRYDENEADKVDSLLKAAMQRKDFSEFQKKMAMDYMSPEIDSIVKGMAKAGSPEKAPSDKSKDPDNKSAVRGPSGRQYMGPEDKADIDAKINAMRAARANAGTAPLPASNPRTGKPDIGTAGQNTPQQQPSVAAGVRPAMSAADLKNLRINKSGLVKAQQMVDRETKAKGPDAGTRLAKRLGVPSTQDRTVKDEETGDTKVVIWGPERVLKFMDSDNAHLPGLSPQQPRAASMQGTDLKPGKSDAERKAQAHAGAKARDAGDIPADRLDKIKAGMLSRSGAPSGEQGRPSRPPSFDFEVFRPHGVSTEVPVNRPDPATGQWMRGKRTVDPSKTGTQWNGYKGKWYTDDEMAKMFPGKEPGGGSKGLVNRATARAGTVPNQGAQGGPIKPGQTAASDFEMDDEDDEYSPDDGWQKI